MRSQKWIIFSASVLFLLGLGGYSTYKFLYKDYYVATTHEQSVIVMIQPGQSARQIGKLLKDAHAIDSAFTFYLNAVLRRKASQMKAGEYEFPASRSLVSIMNQLTQGKVIQHKITIPEGLTINEVKILLLKEDKLKGDLTNDLIEGSLLPETYYFTRGESREAVLKRMQKALQDTLQYHWTRHQHETTLGSPQEALILASIVEKETRQPSERPHIAGVYLNRIKQRMPLQACPTVIYGIFMQTGKMVDHLTNENLTVNSPFNTYINIGLPPGPICNPGQAAIEATLNPMITSDLYFVANGTGSHVFSETFKEHVENHVKLRKIRKEQEQKQE
jgi:UPF0755 protein